MARRRSFPIRVALARDPARLIAWLGLRLVIAEIGLIVGLQTPGAIGTAVTLAGAAVLVYVVLLALHVLSLRLEVRPGEVRVASLIVRRDYPLRQGAVTRMRITRGRGIFGTQLGSFGIEIGLGRIPGRDAVDVVRLSPGPRVILIPTVERRLAVAPSSEQKLLRALKRGTEGLDLAPAPVAVQAPAPPSR